jgi:hypothetical protein
MAPNSDHSHHFFHMSADSAHELIHLIWSVNGAICLDPKVTRITESLVAHQQVHLEHANMHATHFKGNIMNTILLKDTQRKGIQHLGMSIETLKVHAIYIYIYIHIHVCVYVGMCMCIHMT